MRIRWSWWARGFVAMVTVLLVTGCGHAAAPGASIITSERSSGYELPANIHYSNHWVATPAVDLMSADGTFIRAYAEADDVSIFNNNHSEGSYPGFVHANQTGRNSGFAVDDYGYAMRWVLNFTVLSDDSVIADICSVSSINPKNEDVPSVILNQLKYVRAGKVPPVNQKGPSPAPAASVFGDWYATFYNFPGTTMAYSATPCFPSKPPIDKSPVSTPGWPSKESL